MGDTSGRSISPIAGFEDTETGGFTSERCASRRKLIDVAAAVKHLSKLLGIDRPVRAILGSIYEVRTEEPIVHLTYDDGPHPAVTPAVLDVLAECGIQATFFMLAREAERYPDLVAEVRRRGHAVGLHTRTHRPLPELGWRELIDEVITARRDLESVARTRVRWFRPPYGIDGWRGSPIARLGQMQSVCWSADTHDWKGLSGQDPLRNTRKNLRRGGIVLMHDVPATKSRDEDERRGFIPKDQLTRLVLQEVAKRGLTAVPLARLLASGRVLKRVRLS